MIGRTLSQYYILEKLGSGGMGDVYKNMKRFLVFLTSLSMLALSDCRKIGEIAPAIQTVDDAALRSADERVGDWLTHGRTYSEQRYSPLDRINSQNISDLGLVWAFDTKTDRGLEATPIVVDGILYTTGSWSIVFAVDGRTGKQIWKWDPKVPPSYGGKACCDVVNRGVAVYKGKVYVGVLDGRLAALDALSGEVVWEVVTVDRSLPYTITGAPRVVNGKVIIGNGGAEYGVRGYVSAYDAETGELLWRFYTVPGDPSLPFESEAMEQAAKTWNGEWWKFGGGGTVWDSLAYDPDLDLLYVGTGNGSPWNREVRSPGGGDNLYLSSILALRADTGDLVWYYQTTPGDTWDFTATQQLLLADLEIDGRMRKVLMQAPKNGFFYVLDRASGELLSAEPFVEMTWATGIDEKGRPIEAAGSRYVEAPAVNKPGALGGHNWQSMSFNPQTGLVYIPAHESFGIYSQDELFEYKPGAWNLGIDMSPDVTTDEVISGHLLAWDPVQQNERWRAPYDDMANGGTLTTAGNLVFQGTADGRFLAYRADNGEKLWEAWTGSGVMAAPVTYLVDDKQYVSVMAGWGGAYGVNVGLKGVLGSRTLLTFGLEGKQSIPPPATTQRPAVGSIEVTASPEIIKEGRRFYNRWCTMCHGRAAVSGGVISDLRYSDPEIFEMYADIVLEGALGELGMPSFEQWLSEGDVEAVRGYVQNRAAELASKR